MRLIYSGLWCKIILDGVIAGLSRCLKEPAFLSQEPAGIVKREMKINFLL